MISLKHLPEQLKTQTAPHGYYYLKTRFVRFLVAQVATTQHISKESFAFVPKVDLETRWNDEMLYAEYQLSQEEIAYIEQSIRPME